MATIKKILVPVDFSPQSRAAVQHAIVFGQAFGAEIVVAHMYRQSGAKTPGADATLSSFSESEQGAAMREYLESLNQHGVAVRGRLQLVQDETHDAIVALARDERFDLVVLGTHGRTGLSHLLHGSVAERVVRHAHCPVLTIREPDEKRKRTEPPVDVTTSP